MLIPLSSSAFDSSVSSKAVLPVRVGFAGSGTTRGWECAILIGGGPDGPLRFSYGCRMTSTVSKRASIWTRFRPLAQFSTRFSKRTLLKSSVGGAVSDTLGE